MQKIAKVAAFCNRTEIIFNYHFKAFSFIVVTEELPF